MKEVSYYIHKCNVEIKCFFIKSFVFTLIVFRAHEFFSNFIVIFIFCQYVFFNSSQCRIEIRYKLIRRIVRSRKFLFLRNYCYCLFWDAINVFKTFFQIYGIFRQQMHRNTHQKTEILNFIFGFNSKSWSVFSGVKI